MNLIVDIGNTQAKFAVFEGDHMKEESACVLSEAIEVFNKLHASFPMLSKAIISSTANIPDLLEKNLSQSLELIHFSHQSTLNFTNTYGTPETLGLDRLALVAAAVEVYPQKNVLVIDAGTCITYDFVDENSVYQGGAISAGLQMRYKAMHTYTDKLPLLNLTSPPLSYIGKSTNEAMHIGVYKSIIYEIEAYINHYNADYEDLTVVLTGGDYYLLSASIKNSIFATSNFIWKGLNKILQLNSN